VASAGKACIAYLIQQAAAIARVLRHHISSQVKEAVLRRAVQQQQVSERLAGKRAAAQQEAELLEASAWVALH
jgi:hypothetical protein